MRLLDVKLLWARSGNRCAMPTCRMELTAGSTPSLLGEIAHIIARKKDGPRGDDPLPLDRRDDYDNLMILCPTHHTQIDDTPTEWPVETLRRLKAEHELWVTSQLNAHAITVLQLDGPEFVTKRIFELSTQSQPRVWVHANLTPLSLSDDAINPQSREFLDAIHATNLPQVHCINPTPNSQHTRPNRFGIDNEDLRELSQGRGHSIRLYRNGHTEFSICIDSICTYITSLYANRPLIRSDAERFIHYSNIVEALESQSDFLHRVWGLLPFYNMMMSVVLTHTAQTAMLYDSRNQYGKKCSRTVNHEHCDAIRVLDRGASSDEIMHFALQRIVESYGWVLPMLRESDGFIALPATLV